MGARPSLPLDDSEVQTLCEETGFSAKQLSEFYCRFAKLSGDKPLLYREDLTGIPHLKENPLCDRIIHAFFSQDASEITFAQYARKLSVFRRGHQGDSQRDDKIRFLYDMIDSNGDGSITVSEMSAFLSLLIGNNMPPEQINSIALRCMNEADKDADHQIDFEEFKKTLGAVEIEQKMSISALNNS